MIDLDTDRIDAVAFDFVGVVATGRMALTHEAGSSPYVIVMDERVLACVQRLRKAGYATAVVTNNDRGSFMRDAPEIDLAALFDAVVFSSDVGAEKPAAKIYEHAAALLSCAPDRCLFFDDLAVNVDGAVAVGMQGVIVDRTEVVISTVETLLSKSSPR